MPLSLEMRKNLKSVLADNVRAIYYQLNSISNITLTLCSHFTFVVSFLPA